MCNEREPFSGEILGVCGKSGQTTSESNKKHEYVISKQLIRSATSIGANINEANYGYSLADFTAKMQIALKETAETEYWIRLLRLSEYIAQDEETSLLDDCLALKRMLIATLNTAKKKI